MAVSFFAGRWTKPATQINNNAGETKFIKTDTSFIPVQKNLHIVKSKKAIHKTDTTKNYNSNQNYYSAEFDSLIAVDKDSILTKTKVKFDMANTQFAIEQEISYRTFDKMITDTVTVEKIKMEYVPFYNSFTFGFITGIILMLIGVIFG